LGRRLLDQHVLFDVLPDDLATAERQAGYHAVLQADEQDAAWIPPKNLTRVTAPSTVRVSASRPARGGEVTLHLVNYQRVEPEEKRSAGRGIGDERPVPAAGVAVDLRLPAGQSARAVEFLTPEAPEPAPLQFQARDGKIQFAAPEFLVYAVVRVLTGDAPEGP
jgi:hypothetical protein